MFLNRRSYITATTTAERRGKQSGKHETLECYMLGRRRRNRAKIKSTSRVCWEDAKNIFTTTYNNSVNLLLQNSTEQRC